jgi:hypothetical protein
MKIRIGILLLGLSIVAATIAAGAISIYVILYKKPFVLYARISESGFQVERDGQWEDLYVKGVNIGAALPGHWFTEFPEEEEIYTDWFEQIGEMNANCIRVYTLLPSQFYTALANYNKQHPDEVLWLFQEIWPEENPEGMDYLRKDYIDHYYTEIRYVVDAIHGNARIEERKGRAFGVYTSDVSRYVLGYLVGRELEPDEIIVTNENNPNYYFQGEYLSSSEEASPSEAWLAMNCNYVLAYEEEKYSSGHPVSIVSWPTLDVKEHDSEWNVSGLKSLEYNDKVSIDINHINVEEKLVAGFFGAYHIYPNYPDFMNNESSYDSYQDEEGRLRYGGYLKEFIETHTKYPALVAEFGLATGMGNAHSSPDGLNHGGLTEEQQGEGIVRMMKAIQREGYAGGLIFEWMDEWAKKTWMTEPFMIPYDRHAYWHNALDPEQNYGVLAMESAPPAENLSTWQGTGVVKQIGLKHDAAFLYINILLEQALDVKEEKLLIGLDTYDRNRGEYRFMPSANAEAPTGLEFLLEIGDPEASVLLVHPGYNITQNTFASYTSASGSYEQLNRLINNEQIRRDGSIVNAIYEDGSKLTYGTFSDNSKNTWYMEENTIYIRIPWGSLNFTDPSSRMVLDDAAFTGELSRDVLHTVKSDGIMVSALIYNHIAGQEIELFSMKQPYTWTGWDEPLSSAPYYSERLKKSYEIIKDYYGSIE